MANMQNLGLDIALGSIFILGIGIPVTTATIDAQNFTGITATIITFVPVILVAGYIYMVSKKSGLIGGK